MIRCILFDLDNTLIDRDAAFQRFCHEYLQQSWPTLNQCERDRALKHMSNRDRAVLISENHPVAIIDEDFAQSSDTMQSANEPWHGAIWSDAWDDHKRLRLPRLIEPDDRIRRMMTRLRNRFQLAVVTNGSSVVQRAKLGATGAADLFQQVVVSGEFGAPKPDPAIFLSALSFLNVSASEALFVGDDPVRDIIGAKRVGMKTVWIRRGRDWSTVTESAGKAIMERPDDQIDHVTELEGCLASWT